MNKQLIDQIKALPGVKLVAPADGCVVVTFEAVRQGVQCTNVDEANFVNTNKGLKENTEQAAKIDKYGDIVLYLDDHGWDWLSQSDRIYQILPFQSYLKQESLQDKYNEFLLAKAGREYAKGVRFKNLKGEDYITLSGHEDVKIDPDGCITAWGDKRGGFVIMDENGKWAEKLTPIFKTDNNVDIYNEGSYVNVRKTNLEICSTIYNYNGQCRSSEYFYHLSTKEAAEQWVKEERESREWEEVSKLAMETYPVKWGRLGDEPEWDMNEQYRDPWIDGFKEALKTNQKASKGRD